MSPDHEHDDVYIDANGCPTERVRLGGQDVIVHYDDLPESDITVVQGVRCTTALRTVIDIAPELTAAELDFVIKDCLDRGLFTTTQALARIAQADIASRSGARLLKLALTA